MSHVCQSVWHIQLMAAAERRLIAKGCRNINQQLLVVLPHKTLDAIQGKRRKDSYKNLMANTNTNDADLLSEESDAEDEIVPDPSVNQSTFVDEVNRDVLNPSSIDSPARNGVPSVHGSIRSSDPTLIIIIITLSSVSGTTSRSTGTSIGIRAIERCSMLFWGLTSLLSPMRPQGSSWGLSGVHLLSKTPKPECNGRRGEYHGLSRNI